MVKVVNIRDMDPTAYNIYIGRESSLSATMFKKHPFLKDGTVLGNTITIGEGNSREYSIEAHRDFFLGNTGQFEGTLTELSEVASNRTVCLVCWCAPKPCHGDVIAEYLNGMIRGHLPVLEQENIF